MLTGFGTSVPSRVLSEGLEARRGGERLMISVQRALYYVQFTELAGFVIEV